jgi:hypothetical protein
MKRNPKGQTTQKVVVKIRGNGATSCDGKVILEVPRDATKVEIERALVGLADVLPEPNWSLPGPDSSEQEVEIDIHSEPKVVGFDATEEEASASLVRNEDGNLVLEDIPEE